MSESWPRVELAKVGVAVLDCVHETPKDTGEGYPYLAIPNIRDNRIDLSGVRRISKADFEAWTSRYKPASGDVLVTRRGRVGDTAVIPKGLDCAIGQNLVLLRSDGTVVDQRYLSWVCRGPDWWAEVDRLLNVGAVFDSLNVRDLPRFRLPVPPIEEQRRIAGVLGALEDLIDANHRVRATLDRKGLALVEDLVARRRALTVVTLGEAARIVETGRRPRGGVRGITDGVPSIGAESINGLGVFDFSKTKYVPQDFADQMRTGVLESRDVLVYKDGGKPGDFRPHVGMFGDGFPFTHMTINEHVYRVRAAAPLTEPYLYFWLSSDASMAAMRRLGTGAAIPGLNSQALKAISVAVPPTSVQPRLFAALDALVGEALAAASEARRLSQARDELLPLLLSGRLRVEEIVA
jgi:type I restriction enzyme, S subunit